MVVLVRSDGTPAASSLPTQRHQLNLSDRSYFQHHQANPAEDLLIGMPLINRATHKRFIPISRRITDRQGRFAGVVLIALDREALVVRALVRAGRVGEAQARAAWFERRFPESLLRATVRSSLAGAER